MKGKDLFSHAIQTILIISFLSPGVFAKDDVEKIIPAPVISNPVVVYQLVENKITLGISRLEAGVIYDDQSELVIKIEQDGKIIEKKYGSMKVNNIRLRFPVSLKDGQVKITAQAVVGTVASPESEPLYQIWPGCHTGAQHPKP